MANNVTLPKRTTIEGMPHKLAYITPQEGDLLKRMGGSGQMHRGVPAYPPAGDKGGTGGGGGGFGGGGGGGGGRERAMEGRSSSPSSPPSGGGGGGGLDVSKAVQLAQQEKAAQAALEQAKAQQAVSTFGSGDPRTTALAASQGYTAGLGLMGERFGVSQPVRDVIFDESGRVRGVVHDQSIPFGVTGLLAKALGIPVQVYTGDAMYNPHDVSGRFDTPDRGGRPDRVPPVQDPVTGEARCPTGYVFNETLQACIMDTAATSSFQPTAPTAQPTPSGDYYARMGLLDQPPAGLLEAGFGSPQDFAAANTAFRRGAATRPSMYNDPYNLQGYTLLS